MRGRLEVAADRATRNKMDLGDSAMQEANTEEIKAEEAKAEKATAECRRHEK